MRNQRGELEWVPFLLGIVVLTVVGLLMLLIVDESNEKREMADEFNQISSERHLPGISATDYKRLSHDDIKDMLIELKFNIKLPKKETQYMYIYSGS